MEAKMEINFNLKCS